MPWLFVVVRCGITRALVYVRDLALYCDGHLQNTLARTQDRIFRKSTLIAMVPTSRGEIKSRVSDQLHASHPGQPNGFGRWVLLRKGALAARVALTSRLVCLHGGCLA